MTKVRFPRCVGSYNKDTAEITPTEHPKGGSAWDVTIGGKPVGVLRRWERSGVTVNMGPSGGTIRKVREVRWTVYPLRDGGTGHVYDSRAAALRRLRDDAKREG